jgi:hypothetical protein
MRLDSLVTGRAYPTHTLVAEAHPASGTDTVYGSGPQAQLTVESSIRR